MSSVDANNARRERSPLSDVPPGDAHLSDELVERLLREHFARVMPAEFRAPAGSENSGGNAPTVLRTLPPSKRFAGRAIVGVATAALVLIAAGLLIQFPGAPVPDRRSAATSDSAPASGAADEPARAKHLAGDSPLIVLPTEGGRSVEYSVTERDEPVETFRMETEHGPVEQRSRRKITNVSVIDPETGEKVEVELPELTIEIFPIER